MASATISSQSEQDSGSMSGSDSKKRNKLGYHRTAVACGHCRRRKIRCMPSTDPTETKCANCIRLKKECQFFPVDQNGLNTRKNRSDSRVEASADEPSISRTSVSPPKLPSSTSHSFGKSYNRRTSSSAAWTDASGAVTSPPGRLESVHTMDQQEWTQQSPPQNLMQQQFSQPDPHPSGSYWMQPEDNHNMEYQQQYGIPVTSGSFTQESNLAYQNTFQDARQPTGRNSLSGIPTSGIDQALNSYKYYNTTFSDIDRNPTIPVSMFNHAAIHGTPQLAAGPGQIMYDQGYGQSIMNNNQTWFSPQSQQSVFSPQYLPTHQERKYSYTS